MLKKNSGQEGGSVEEFIGRIQMWKCSSGGIREKEMQSCAIPNDEIFEGNAGRKEF